MKKGILMAIMAAAVLFSGIGLTSANSSRDNDWRSRDNRKCDRDHRNFRNIRDFRDNRCDRRDHRIKRCNRCSVRVLSNRCFGNHMNWNLGWGWNN